MKLKIIILLSISFFLFSSCFAQKEIINPKHFDVVETNIEAIHQAFKNRTCNCDILVSAYLKRIAAYDQSTHLNAIVVTNFEAIKTARALDAEYKRTKKLRPLHCIPMIIKDNYQTAGLQTTGGSILFKGFKPDEDAHMVKLLKDAGAIVLAKSNMAEWAFSPKVTISSIAGETLNPYNLEHTTAGSSGGTAAAVAANLGESGVGTDTGNSIRGPSSHNDLVGFRPTLGLCSRVGIIPLFLGNDTGGPIARSVADATRILQVVAGYDPKDPLTENAKGKIPANYQQYLKKDGLKGARIGVLRILMERNIDPQVKALFEQAVADLKKAGAIIVDPLEIPNFYKLAQQNWGATFKEDINTYLASLGDKAPVKNFDEILASGKYPDYTKSIFDYYQTAEKPSPEDLMDVYHDPRRIVFRNAIEKVMNEQHLGAIIYPTWNFPPAKIGDFSGYKGDNSQVIAPRTGQPAFTIPMGFTYDNLPAGIQFLGKMFDEATLIRYTFAYEQATKHRKPPANFGELKKRD
ncbi:MAG: amidase family protein [Janthinobacterium lividum]